jgi:hypothetical protein
MTPSRLSIALAGLAGLSLASLIGPASAQDPAPVSVVAAPALVGDGRPTGLVDGTTGAAYERERIKRTVPLETAGLAERWDVLYADGANGTAYLDWDADFLYVAWESPSAEAVRIDLDAKDDGWLRGADNVSFFVQPAGEGAAAPTVTAQRFDAVQNRDRPVFAASPIPAAALKAVAGATGRGTSAVLVAIPRTELAGLERKDGARFGLRIEHGAAAAVGGEAAGVGGRAMLRLALAEEVPASRDGVTVILRVFGARDVSAGETARAILEVKNESRSEVPVSGLFVRGYGAAQPLVEFTAADAVQSLPPGKKVSRELRTPVNGLASLGALPLVGGVTVNGRPVAALAAIDYVEPYAVTVQADARPVKIKSDGSPDGDGKRAVAVTLLSRVNAKADAELSIALPPGWLMEGGETRRKLTLRGEGDRQAFSFRLVPPSTGLAAGPQTVTVTAQVGGKSYTASATVPVGEGTASAAAVTPPTKPAEPPAENGEHAPQ